MADPLTVIGAVASVTQLIGLGTKIIAKSHEIHTSAVGMLIEDADIEATAKKLSNIASGLQVALTRLSQHDSVSEDDRTLHDLCEGCVSVSTELISALEKLKLRGKRNAFKSLRQALKCVRNRDEIESIEKRLDAYQKVLDTQIIVSLRSNINVLALQQLTLSTSLDKHARSIIKTLITLDEDVKVQISDQTLVLKNLHDENVANSEAQAIQNHDDHEATRAEIGRLSLSIEERENIAMIATSDTQAVIELAMDQNLVEHKKTRQEMQRLKDQAERQIEQLIEQIRRLKIDLEVSVKDMVSKMATASAREQQNLKEITNAKFNLWAALELMLEKLKAFVSMFKFNFSDEPWSSTIAVKTWKLMPYPRPAAEQSSDPAADDEAQATERSLAYLHVDLCYPIAAGNVPMVEMCLNHGAKVNKRLPVEPYKGMTPLMKAVATAYEFSEFDSIRTILPMRRNARKIVQLLIDHGADPKQVDAEGRDALHVARHPRLFLLSKDRGELPVDWLIEQLIERSQDDDVVNLMNLSDAVWGGNLGKVRAILSKLPELCHIADDYGASALGIAAFCGIEEAARLLLTHGASPNGPDPTGSTPIAIAVALDRLAMVELLLLHGAKFDEVDLFLGLRPLEYAAREGNDAMCLTFLRLFGQKSKADLMALLSKPLYLAVRHYQISTVELLLDNGADVRTNISTYLAKWEKEAYKGANFGRLMDSMTPRTYVENKIRERALPPDLPSEKLLKVLIAWEKRIGRQSLSPTSNDSFERLPDLSSRHRVISKRRSFMLFTKSSTAQANSEAGASSQTDHLAPPPTPEAQGPRPVALMHG